MPFKSRQVCLITCFSLQLQDFVDDYKNSNLQIVVICEKICDTNFISLKSNHSYEIKELVLSMEQYRNEILLQFVEHYQQILQYIIFVFEGFETHIANVRILIV